MSETVSHLAIRASAGSGKTYELAIRFIGALAATGSPARVLATTFTRKAAGEILARTVLRLADAASDDHAAQRLATELGIPSRPELWARLLARSCRGLDQVRISTIDSLFARMLSAMALDAGFVAAPVLTESRSPEARRMRLEALTQVLGDARDEDTVRILDDLNGSRLKRGVVAPFERLVDSLYEVASSTTPEAWGRLDLPPCPVAVTLADASATLRSAAEGPLPARLKAGLLDTVEAAERCRWALVLGKGPGAKVGPTPAADGTTEIGPCVYWGSEIPFETCRALRCLCDAAAHHLARAVRDRSLAMRDVLDRYAASTRAIPGASELLLFGDLPRVLARAAARSSSTALACRFGPLPDHVLLDEFQDTSADQWRVLRTLLLDPTPPETSPRASVFCVGDTKQAIYAWRGGCAGILDGLDDQLPGLRWETRDVSYRSSQTVLDAVNRVFANLHVCPLLEDYSRLVQRWRVQFRIHTSARALPGHVVLREAPSNTEGPEETADDADGGAEPSAASLYTDWVVGQIAGIRLGVPQRTIGVLTRTNKTASAIADGLRSCGIAVTLEGPGALADDPATEIILSALLIADHPGSVAEAFHVANSPLATELALDDYGPLSRAAASSRIRTELARRGYAAVIGSWASVLAPYGTQRTARRLTQLVEAAVEYEPRATPRPSDFVTWVRSRVVSEPTEAGVRVMTVHQAKGLEFDVVVAPELHSRIHAVTPPVVDWRPDETSAPTAVFSYPPQAARDALPQLRQAFEQHRQREMGDALNLLYVVMTRPRHALHLLVPSVPRKRDGSPQRPPLAMSSLLRDVLASERTPEPGLLYSAGSSAWNGTAPSRDDPPRDPPSSPTPTVSPILFAHTVRSRHWPDTAPSDLEELPERTARDLFRLDTESRRRGALIHGWFQLVGWWDDGLPGKDELLDAGRRIAPGDPESWITGQIPTFQAMLAHEAVRLALTRPAAASDLWRERPFVVRTGASVVRGRLDRMVVITHKDGRVRVELTDYKTDLIEAEAVPARARRYDAQMRSYVLAVSEMLMMPIHDIRAQLLFVAPGVAHQIDMSRAPQRRSAP
jgi:ATP-dependent exoDNAse (exonuclease V) beta subunit